MKAIHAFFCACAVLALFSCRTEAALSGKSVAGYDGTWTTIVYMAADNDLEAAAMDDFREMVSGASGLREAGHTVLVLLDRSSGYDTSAGNWADTRLFKLTPSGERSADEAALYAEALASDVFSFLQIDCSRLGLSRGVQTELNMGAPETLKGILRFAREEYSAAHYALIMWGHGSGWRGYAIDETSESVMSLPDLHAAVSSLDMQLSVIAFDCCYGAMLETAYELRGDAQFLVAAERDEPAAGWNYAFFLQNLVKNADCASGSENTPDADAAEWYARCAVDAFARQYAFSRGDSITALRLPEIDGVFRAFDSFAGEAAAAITTHEAALSFSDDILTRSSFLSGEYPSYRFADMDSAAVCLLENGVQGGNAAFAAQAASAAETLRQSLRKATLVSFSGGAGKEEGMSDDPMLAVYVATIRSGGVVEADYPQLYVRGSGVAGQCAFVRDSTGWVPQQKVSQSTGLLDHLYRLPLP